MTLPSEEVVSDLLADDILGGERYGVNTNVVRQQVLRPDNITEIRTKDRVIDFGTNGDIINPIDSGEILVDAQTTDEVKIPLKAQEKILTEQEAAAELKPQDYVATITEVLDANRIRVNLSYNDGVNKYQHKGEDERKKKFKNFKVNYIKNNIGRYKTYMVKDNHYYYLVTNEKISTDGRKKYFKFQQPLQNISVDDKVTFVEKRLPDYEDNVRLEPFIKAENNDIFLRIPNLNSVENPINFQGTTYNSNDGLLSNKQSDSDDIERLLVSSSLLDVQPNIDYQKTTTDLKLRMLNDGRVGVGVYPEASGDNRGLPVSGRMHVTEDIAGYQVIYAGTTAGSGNVYGIHIAHFGQDPDNNTSRFYGGAGSSGNRFLVYSDGDVVNHDNSYGAISDERIKSEIVDANSQWDDIKALRVRNYKKNDDIAQYGLSLIHI